MSVKIPKVGIIVTNFNYANYIQDCIESIFSQTYKNIEVVVVDDASTDGTDKVINKLRGSYSFLYSKNIQNSGQTRSFYNGLKLLSKDVVFVQSVDADDILKEDCVETLVNALHNAGYRIPYAYGMFEAIDKDKTILWRRHSTTNLVEDGRIVVLKPHAFRFPRFPGLSPTSGMMFRKQVLQRFMDNIDLDNLRISTDYLLAKGLSFGYGSCKVNKFVFSYRIHGENNFASSSSSKGLEVNLKSSRVKRLTNLIILSLVENRNSGKEVFDDLAYLSVSSNYLEQSKFFNAYKNKKARLLAKKLKMSDKEKFNFILAKFLYTLRISPSGVNIFWKRIPVSKNNRLLFLRKT